MTKYKPGDRVGQFVIVERTAEHHGNNAVFIAQCTLCRRKLKRTLHHLHESHNNCFRFTREQPTKRNELRKPFVL